jgi:hypothetical protein
MYELWNINCKPERDVWVVKYKLQAWTWCMSCDIWTYFKTHTLRSVLQFVFHNSCITLRLAVYISQLMHYAQTYSLYIITHTSRSGLHFKPERNVWVVKYKLEAWAWCMSCEIQTARLNVMYELWNINCSGLQFIFHNSHITLRLTVCISQLMLYAQACSLYITTHALRSDLQFIYHNSYTVSQSVMYELWIINCMP